ncbi:hypothetical protein QA612_08140 [Evansella sp. AB-P1]|uniref:hypothetical protein n=1 Tax=Evansella sp. AB-P1 TaxID=3037653 RepID=UPI0024203FDB|nr:hypothetical protein [Evansella sp. AB-P1]MDG5787463.1 hypothetical protein [Evansella sp. AB-P1]
MIGKIFVILGVIAIFYIVLFHYTRFKKVIILFGKSVYPSNGSDYEMFRTTRGKPEELSFQSKDWKFEKRMGTITCFFFLGLGLATVIFVDFLDWYNSLFFMYFPFLYLNIVSTPTFFIFEDGFCLNRKIYFWQEVEGFSITPVTMQHKMYGMFDLNRDWYEVKIEINKRFFKTQYVYVRSEGTVEELRAQFIHFGLKEKVDGNKEEKAANVQ